MRRLGFPGLLVATIAAFIVGIASARLTGQPEGDVSRLSPHEGRQSRAVELRSREDVLSKIETLKKRLSEIDSPLTGTDEVVPGPAAPVGKDRLVPPEHVNRFLKPAIQDFIQVRLADARRHFRLDEEQFAAYRKRLESYFEQHPTAALGAASRFVEKELLVAYLNKDQLELYQKAESQRAGGFEKVESQRIAAAGSIDPKMADAVVRILREEGHQTVYEVHHSFEELEAVRAELAQERAALERARVRLGGSLTPAQLHGLEAYLEEQVSQRALFIEEFRRALQE